MRINKVQIQVSDLADAVEFYRSLELAVRAADHTADVHIGGSVLALQEADPGPGVVHSAWTIPASLFRDAKAWLKDRLPGSSTSTITVRSTQLSSEPRPRAPSRAPVTHEGKMIMRVLGLHWVGTRTDAHDATVQFFNNILGLRTEHEEPDFTVLRVADGATVEVFGPASRYNQHLSSPVVGFLVDDLAEAAEQLRQAGTEIVLPIQRSETGAWLHFRAPDGFLYELSEMYEAEAEPGPDTYAS